MFISIFSGVAAGVAVGDGDVDGICMPGIFMSIFSGEAVGFADGEGVAEGICMPGIFICSGDAEGCAFGVCAGIPDMPGIFISILCGGAFFEREVERDEEGIFMPFIFIPLIPPFFRVRLLLTTADLDFDFGLLLGLLPMFMPGMFCMSCCARAGRAEAPKSRPAMAIAQNFERKIDLKLFMIPSRMVPVSRELNYIDCFSLFSSKLDLFCERRCALQLYVKLKLGREGLNQEDADENVTRNRNSGWSMLSRRDGRSKRRGLWCKSFDGLLENNPKVSL